MSKKGRARNEMLSGFSNVLIFSTLYFFVFHRAWWVIFPLIFAGVMPFVKGLTRFIEERSTLRKQQLLIQKEKKILPEKMILQIAKRKNGRISPAIVALESGLSIEEAEKELESIAARGYASMEIKTNGGLEYVFPDFLPSADDTLLE
jgi:hypothetical protein